jgi:hypothetical protein
MSGKVLGVATGLAIAGAVVFPLADHLVASRRRQPLQAVAVRVPRPNLSGLAPAAPALPGAPSPAAAMLKNGHAAVDEVVRQSRGDRVKALAAYGTAWRLYGEASEAVRADAAAGAQHAAELNRLRARLQSLQAEGVAILGKVPTWLLP